MKKNLRNDQFTTEVQRKCLAYSHILYYSMKGNVSKRRVYKEVITMLPTFGCNTDNLQKELKEQVYKLCEAGRIAYKYNHDLEYWYERMNLVAPNTSWRNKSYQ